MVQRFESDPWVGYLVLSVTLNFVLGVTLDSSVVVLSMMINSHKQTDTNKEMIL